MTGDTKRFLAAFTAVLLMIGLAGCRADHGTLGDGSAGADTETPSATPAAAGATAPAPAEGNEDGGGQTFAVEDDANGDSIEVTAGITGTLMTNNDEFQSITTNAASTSQPTSRPADPSNMRSPKRGNASP